MTKYLFCLGLFLTIGLAVLDLQAQDGEVRDPTAMASETSYTQLPENVQIPPGMEIIRSDDVRIVAPKGSQLRKVNNLFIIESAEEYAARKFNDVEARLAQLAQGQERIEKELAEMKTDIRG